MPALDIETSPVEQIGTPATEPMNGASLRNSFEGVQSLFKDVKGARKLVQEILGNIVDPVSERLLTGTALEQQRDQALEACTSLARAVDAIFQMAESPSANFRSDVGIMTSKRCVRAICNLDAKAMKAKAIV